MGYPLGKAPTQTGTMPTPTEMPTFRGTTPDDMQRILGAQYVTQGLLSNGGGNVIGTSDMSYKVYPGAAFVWTNQAQRLGVLVPFDGVTVPTDPAPASGSRTDVVYVDTNGDVRVNVGYQPGGGGGVILAKFTVPAGVSSTASLSPSVDRDYAIATGATRGRLHAFHDPANGVKGNQNPMTLGTGRFAIPSDRYMRFDLTHCISAMQDADQTAEAAALRWRVYIDNVLEVAFVTRAQWKNPQVNFMSFTKSLPKGVHTVHYVQDQIEGLKTGFMHHKGGPDAYPGNRFEVWDAGAAR